MHLHESVEVERQLVLFGFLQNPNSFSTEFLPLTAQVTESQVKPESSSHCWRTLPGKLAHRHPSHPPNSPHINSLTFPYNLFPSSHPFLDKPVKRDSFVGKKLNIGSAFFEAFGKKTTQNDMNLFINIRTFCINPFKKEKFWMPVIARETDRHHGE